MASLIAASTAHATWGEPMILFFVFYRCSASTASVTTIWALGDMRDAGSHGSDGRAYHAAG
jgi:pyruvate dehydrogenase complex dehydrogenase (E1) component